MATGGASGRERGAPPRFTVEIERLAAGGEGVGRVGGKAVFVPGAAPGDLLEAVVVREWRTFVRGRALRLLRASPVRVAPPCPAFGACGGCCWQHLAPAAQLEAKRGIVGDALRRIGRIAAPPVPLPLPSPRDYGYRHRARLHLRRGGAGPALGFFRHGTRALVSLTACPVLAPALSGLIAPIRAAAGRHPGSFGRCAAVRLEADWEGGTVLVTPEDAAGSPLHVGEEAAALLRGAGVARVAVWPERAELRLGPGADALVTTGGAFSQVNLAQNAALVRTALALAAPRPGEEVLDLFCGLGNLSLPAARLGARVLGVDLDAAAIELAGENARRAGVAGASFRRGDAADAARALALGGRRFPLVMLNPPRTGARAAVEALLPLGAARVLIVSCEPATLARDAAALVAAGYRLEAAVTLDLFPQTAHVETVALLRREDGPSGRG